MTARLPWWFKVGAKLALSRLPLGYAAWRRAGLFLHGAMNQPTYALEVFQRHFSRSFPEGAPESFCSLELGPGDSLFSALIARSVGAGRSLLVDVGPFAIRALAPYLDMARHLREQGLPAPDPGACGSVAELLALCQASYLTHGLDSLRSLPDASVDWVWSQAVLEHIRASAFEAYMRELRRVMKPTAVASHRVDLKDHLGGSLNHLRFGDGCWEGRLFRDAGFYTNRIRFKEMCAIFVGCGFRCEVLEVDRWKGLPMARSSLAPRFRELSEEELCVQGFDVLLRPEPFGAITSGTYMNDQLG